MISVLLSTIHSIEGDDHRQLETLAFFDWTAGMGHLLKIVHFSSAPV